MAHHELLADAQTSIVSYLLELRAKNKINLFRKDNNCIYLR